MGRNVVDSLSGIRARVASVCNPVTAAAEAKIKKFISIVLVDDRYLFQPLASETEGAAGASTEVFLSKLSKNLFLYMDEP